MEVADIKLSLKLEPRLPLVAIGPLEFNQVIFGVLSNAIEASPVGGGVYLKTKRVKNDDIIQIDGHVFARGFTHGDVYELGTVHIDQ